MKTWAKRGLFLAGAFATIALGTVFLARINAIDSIKKLPFLTQAEQIEFKKQVKASWAPGASRRVVETATSRSASNQVAYEWQRQHGEPLSK